MNHNTFFFVDDRLDELPLSIESFRVYAHLCQLSAEGKAFFCKQEMAEKCFRGSYPHADSHTLYSIACKALKELVDWNLIQYIPETNDYTLTPSSEWKE